MSKIKNRSAPQGEFRALTRFDALPPHHAIFLVEDDGSEPHLHRNEYAVVDTTDLSPAHGELYLVQFSEHGARHAKQIKSDWLNITRPGAEPSLVWWLCDLRGFRKTDDRLHGIPVFAGVSDGPYQTEYLASVGVGRIVGYEAARISRKRRAK